MIFEIFYDYQEMWDWIFYLYRLLRQDQNGSNNNKEPDDQPDDELPCYKSRSFHRQVI